MAEGPGRRSGPSGAWWIIAGVVLVAGVAVVGTGSSSRPVRDDPATSGSDALAPTTTSTLPPSLPQSALDADIPALVEPLALEEPIALTLLALSVVPTASLTVVDLEMSQRTRYGPPQLKLPYVLTDAMTTADGTVVVLSNEAAFGFPAGIEGGGKGLGSALAFAPATSGGEVWLVRDGPEPSLRMVSVDGGLPIARLELPIGTTPIAGLGSQVLVEGARIYELVGQSSRLSLEGEVAAASGITLALARCEADGFSETCEVVAVDLTGAPGRHLALPAGLRLAPMSVASLAPDEKQFAVAAFDGESEVLLVVDLETGESRILGGRLTATSAIVWSRDSAWLVEAQGRDLVAHRAADGHSIFVPGVVPPGWTLVP